MCAYLRGFDESGRYEHRYGMLGEQYLFVPECMNRELAWVACQPDLPHGFSILEGIAMKNKDGAQHGRSRDQKIEEARMLAYPPALSNS